MTNLVSLPTDYINVYLFVVDLHKTHERLFKSRSPTRAITDLWISSYGSVWSKHEIKCERRLSLPCVTLSWLVKHRSITTRLQKQI